MRLRFRSEYAGRKARCASCDQPLVVQGDTIPDHDVFISYSSRDKQVADALCAALEAKRMRCWIAPRDVMPGKTWAGAVLDAIEDSRVMVLVYSASANTSPQVIREVDRAVTHNVIIIPFRLEAAQMSKEMEYYIGAAHWLDAMTPPLESHIDKLIDTVQRLSGRGTADATGVMEPARAAPAKSPWKAIALVALALIIAGAVYGGMQLRLRQKVASASPTTVRVPASQPASPNAALAAPVIRHGQWRVDSDELSFIGDRRRPDAGIAFGDSQWSNYIFTCKVLPNSASAFSIQFHFTENGGNMAFGSALLNTFFRVWTNRGTFELISGKQMRLEPDRWHDLRLETRGHEYKIFCDGEQLFNGTDARFDHGRLRFTAGSGATRIRDMKVVGLDGKVLMDGFPDLSKLPSETHDTAPQPPASDIHVVDLLRQVNLASDTLLGHWTASNGKLVSSNAECQVQFPYVPSGEYDLRVEFERPAAANPIGLIGSWNGHMFSWFGGLPGSPPAFAMVDGKRVSDRRSPSQLKPGRRVVVLSVRKQSVRAYVDGQQWGMLRTDYKNVELPPKAKKPEKPTVGLWTGGDIVTVHAADVIEIRPGTSDEGDESNPTTQ